MSEDLWARMPSLLYLIPIKQGERVLQGLRVFRGATKSGPMVGVPQIWLKPVEQKS